jgi:hypothetical protein
MCPQNGLASIQDTEVLVRMNTDDDLHNLKDEMHMSVTSHCCKNTYMGAVNWKDQMLQSYSLK